MKPQQAQSPGGVSPVGRGLGPALPSSAPLKWRVLEVYCRAGDPLLVSDVTRRLAPMQTRPFASVDEYLVWRAAKTNTKAVSQAVRRLAYEGFLMPAGPPRLEPQTRERFRRLGWEGVRPVCYTVDQHGDMSRKNEDDSLRERFRRFIAEALADYPDGLQYTLLLELTGGSTEAGRESHTWRLAFRDLVEDGALIPGDARLPTLLGREKVRSGLGKYRRER